MAMDDRKLSVCFLPYFVTSHLIPLVDTARLFATHGVRVTIITTPCNFLLFKDSVDRDIATGREIKVLTLKFPSAEVGLPEGIENTSSVTSEAMTTKLMQGIALMRKPMEELIHDNRPDCIVSDMFYPWTVDLAEEMKIPRLVVHAGNCFYYCIVHNLKVHAPHEKVESDFESFVIPGLPDKIEMTRAQLPDHIKTKTRYGEIMDVIKESELRSLGIIFTSFSEIEPAYVDYLKKVLGRKCWHVGLPSQILGRNKIAEETDSETEQTRYLRWLDDQKPNSVLYVCFGSMIRFSDAQLTVIALALESSQCPFVWVVRKEEREGEPWMPGGFEERMRETNKGVVVTGWAPQVSILNHPAIGGFMTHCGWNSVLEGITAGVPAITWPLFAEQFYNEKLLTQVLKISIEVGSEKWNHVFVIRSPPVAKEKIMKAINNLMGSSEEAHEMRRRVKEISGKIKKSGEGGVSYNNLSSLIEEIKACVSQKRNNN